MTYAIIVSPAARRDLDRLPESVVAAVYEFMAGPLADNPHRVGKPLTGDLSGQYSARRGVYRIVYRILEDVVQVQVIRIRHRSTAYRP